MMQQVIRSQRSPLTVRLVTCSFRGDLDVCRLLCESIDRFVPPEIGHSLFVPKKDMPLFADFASPRRTIASQESLLPRGFWKLPMPGPAVRSWLKLPRRDVFLTPYSLPVRGWIAQQIMKLSAADAVDADVLVHVDSDCAFIRPLAAGLLVKEGQVRLYRNPQMVALQSHRIWHHAAGRLLGLPDSDFHGAEYIDQLVVWRRDVVMAATRRIAEVAGRDWRIVLARTPHFAEYILYGVFADRVLGLEQAGLFTTERSLCQSRWSGSFEHEADETAFIDSIATDNAACLIQSTIAMSGAARRRIFDRATSRAALQDKSA